MKRRPFNIASLLLAGAIVNVAVAWGCAIWPPRIVGYAHYALPASEQKWFRPISRIEFQSLLGGRTDFRGETRRWRIAAQLPETQPPVLAIQILQSYGLPFRALEHEMESIVDQPNGGNERVTWRWAMIQNVPSSRSDDTPNLPLRPVWIGFFINSCIYALALFAIVWAFIAVPLVLRRRRRMQRGLCPACTYPVGTSEVCTECGKQLE